MGERGWGWANGGMKGFEGGAVGQRVTLDVAPLAASLEGVPGILVWWVGRGSRWARIIRPSVRSVSSGRKGWGRRGWWGVEIETKKFFMKLVKRDWGVTVMNTVFDGFVGDVKAIKNMIRDVLWAKRSSEKSKFIKNAAMFLNIFIDGGGAFGKMFELGFELFNMTAGGFGIGMSEDVPRLLGGGGTRDERAKSGRESANKGTEEEFILTNPGNVGWVENSLAISRGNFERGSHRGAINELMEIIANEESFKLCFPYDIVGGGEFLDGMSVHDCEGFGGLGGVGKGVVVVSHGREKKRR